MEMHTTRGPVLDITLRGIEYGTSYQLKGTLVLRFCFVILRYPTSHEDRVTLEDAAGNEAEQKAYL